MTTLMTRWAATTVLAMALGVAGCATTEPPAARGPAAPPSDLHSAFTRYQQALRTVCDTGVTAELRRRYDDVVRATDAAGYGGGRGGNFWGPRHPEAAYLDCFQSPSFL